jgi:putative phage-type endonuclease
MEQRSPEWFAARCGKVTASRIADMTARIKSGWGASRANYLAELVAERLTGVPASGYVNAPMLRGIETEPEAIIAYEFYSGRDVEPADFIPHPTIEQSGASPDGLLGSDGVLEVKCPNTSTHIDTLLGKTVPQKYVLQIQWQLACSGGLWGDFVSYDPRMPEELKLFVQRVQRDDEKIRELESEVITFLAEVDSKVDQLLALTDKTPLETMLEKSIQMVAG